MGRLGWPEGPVAVVGDDCERDINPAGQLGLAAYCVNSQTEVVQAEDGQLVKSGKLEDLLTWIDSSPVGSLTPVYSRPSSWLAQVRATPAVVDSFCRALPQDRWCQRPAEKEWCLTEILCHLRDVDLEVNLPRLRKFGENENPFLAGQDTDPWSETRQYYLQDGQQALRDFFTARQELVALLEGLTPEDWHRPARHAIFGPTRLQELVNILVAHDRLHLQQIKQLLERISPNLPIS